MLCTCYWIVLYIVHFTAFCLGGPFFSGDGVVHRIQNTLPSSNFTVTDNAVTTISYLVIPQGAAALRPRSHWVLVSLHGLARVLLYCNQCNVTCAIIME